MVKGKQFYDWDHQVFHCGFRPNAGSYRDYVLHISKCADHECARRYTNHLMLRAHFARKYGTSLEDRPAGRGTFSSDTRR